MICAKCRRETPVNHLKWAEGLGGKRHEVWNCPAEALAAQPRPKLEKVREFFRFIDCDVMVGERREKFDAALAELDAAEGR